MREIEENGFYRVAVVSPELKIGDTDFNMRAMIECMEKGDDLAARLLIFPELSVTGYSCGDLFYQKKLLNTPGKWQNPW